MDRLSDIACSGPGTCHGCMCWCPNCGDVSAMCHTEGSCDRHHCATASCRVLLTKAEREHDANHHELDKLCFVCMHHEDCVELERSMMNAQREVDEWERDAARAQEKGDGTLAATYRVWALHRAREAEMLGVALKMLLATGAQER